MTAQDQHLAANAALIPNILAQPKAIADTVPLQPGRSIAGLQAQLWSETVRRDSQVDYMLFPRLLALAERAWSKPEWEPAYVAGAGYQPNDKRVDDVGSYVVRTRPALVEGMLHLSERRVESILQIEENRYPEIVAPENVVAAEFELTKGEAAVLNELDGTATMQFILSKAPSDTMAPLIAALVLGGGVTLNRSGGNTAKLALGAITRGTGGALEVAAAGLATTTTPNSGAGILPGVTLAGGKGGLLGPIVAVFILRLVRSDLTLLAVDPNAATIIEGTIMVGVVMLGAFIAMRGNRA